MRSNGSICRAYGIGGGPDRGDDRLVDVTLEADVGAVAPQPVLTEGRPADPGHEPHPAADAAEARSRYGTGVVEVAADLLVGVDVEDPVAGGEVEAAVARRGEVALPGLVRDDGSVSFGDRDRCRRWIRCRRRRSRRPVHRSEVRQASRRSASSLDDDRGRQRHRHPCDYLGHGRSSVWFGSGGRVVGRRGGRRRRGGAGVHVARRSPLPLAVGVCA